MKAKGSLTVEAAVVVPLFLLVIINLSVINHRYYVYEQVDFAMTQAVKDLAGWSYFYGMTGINTLKGAVDDINHDKRIQENVDNILDEGTAFAKVVFSSEIYIAIGDAFKLIFSGGFTGLVNGLKALWSVLTEKIIPLIKNIVSIIQSLVHLITRWKATAVCSGAAIYTEFEKFFCILILDARTQYYLDKSYEELGIVGKINYRNSDFYCKDMWRDAVKDKGFVEVLHSQVDDKRVELENLIMVRAEYTMTLPLNLIPAVNQPLKHEITMRAWMGGAE